MIKPDGMPLENEILKLIEPLVDIVASRLFSPVDIEKIERLYSVHKDKFFYPYLIDYFRGKPVRTYVLCEREDAQYQKNFVDDFLELVGDTDPERAKPGTIRSLSTDSLKASIPEKRTVRNLVHRSTTPEEAKKEAAIFFGDDTCDRGQARDEGLNAPDKKLVEQPKK